MRLRVILTVSALLQAAPAGAEIRLRFQVWTRKGAREIEPNAGQNAVTVTFRKTGS